MLLLINRLSRRDAMCPVCRSELSTIGVPNFLAHKFIPKWSYPKWSPAENGHQFCSELLYTVDEMIGIRKLITSAHHAISKGGTECVSHMLARRLPVVVKNHQDDWDEHPAPH